jgi:RHS repeat-associated protein
MKKRFFVLVISLFLLFQIVIVIADSEIHDIGFTGQRYDSSIDLIHFPYRTYDSNAGRFLQRDPSGYIDGENLYEYVGGNALGSVDSLGLQSGAGFGRFLVRRLDELTAAGKINAEAFTAKMRAAEGVDLTELKTAWKSSLPNDPHRQLITALGIYEYRDLDIRFMRDIGEIADGYYLIDLDPEVQVPIGRGLNKDLTTLDSILGEVTYSLLFPERVKELDYDDNLKMFRIAVDAELFATKGDVSKAIKNLLRRDQGEPVPIIRPGFQVIKDASNRKGVSLTNVETYGIARYLHNIAGDEYLIGEALLSPLDAIGTDEILLESVFNTENRPSRFFINRFTDAVIEVKQPGWKISFEETLDPGKPSVAKRRKLINLLSKIERGR